MRRWATVPTAIGRHARSRKFGMAVAADGDSICPMPPMGADSL
ncbi:MAG TPA: hypothetical protein PK052_11075 [Anaerohalosphaeraceae bacterium]|nr:hypothetical protein [Anaerohalosphaeraceae bacterium]HOM77532.1 hypothetical protein [Anaerohalosphaeraceae bacterium]